MLLSSGSCCKKKGIKPAHINSLLINLATPHCSQSVRWAKRQEPPRPHPHTMKVSLLAFALLAAQATTSYIRSCNKCRLEKQSAAAYVMTYS